MSYERTIDRKHPGCLIFLLDQSHSMTGPMASAPGQSKAEAVAGAINTMLYTVVRHCTKDVDAPPRHYYDIAVIGYGGTGVSSLLAGAAAGQPLASVGQIAEGVLRHDQTDGNGVLFPVWFDPMASGGTPMCGAFDFAGKVAYGWTQAHPDSFPPIVFNITDGDATDGDPELWANRLHSLSTDDGNLLLFTIHLSSGVGVPVSFPASPSQIPDEFGRRMYEISSELPDFMRQSAGHQTSSRARGIVCNANIGAVINALRVGTSLDYLAGA